MFNLLEAEGWKVIKTPIGHQIITPYKDDIGLIRVKHPALAHLEIYRKHSSTEVKFQHLKKAHDILWPETVWHEWTERRFKAFCEDWNYITLAAGASASKSYDVAKYAILFWYANPSERNVTVASVTLSSLLTRVWGYLTNHMKVLNVKLPYKYYRGGAPRILLEEQPAGKNKIDDDTLHGIFAVTAKSGDDDQAIGTWIGKHPKEKILLILDECTDMPMAITNALPNLNSHPEKFQLIGIGNSNSTLDLHGILSTPKAGWDSVSIELQSWKTTQPKGVCLYFSPYDSPAVVDPDPERRKVLEKFLIGKETLETKEKELGTDSEKFYRWVLGFWKSRNTEDVITTEGFLKDFNPSNRVEWSGHYPLQRVAGLDPAFSTGGDKCVLRIANVGHAFDRKVKIDFMQESLLFEIKLLAIVDKSVERQIAEQVVSILMLYKVPLDHLAVDVTGQGRAIGEVIKIFNESKGYPLGFGTPMKIYSMGQHNINKSKKSVPDILPVSTHILWNTMREYIETGQVCGLDLATRKQMANRLILTSGINNRKMLENKHDYKVRMSALGTPHSPDEADAAALCFQVLRHRLGIEPGAIWNNPDKTMQQKHLEKMEVFKLQHAGVKVISIQSHFNANLAASLKFKPF